MLLFLIRQSKPEDVPTLLKLARMVYFINLPPDDRIIAEKIQHSQGCFSRISGRTPKPTPGKKGKRAGVGSGFSSSEQDSDMFMFTIEDTDSGAVIGTSQVRAHQGGPGNPNWAFKISEKTFRSESLGSGTTHKVGQLYGDESGPTEVGGLILQPSLRGHKLRPGRLISFIRFHLIGLYREVFAERIIAEMMAPVSQEGDNVFWDAFGRKFIPVKYAEADRFCQHNRKFIPELLPKEEIFLTLFPLEVQNMVGVVSRETIPARRMLESLGFAYRGFVDPFDGGPHLEAPASRVPLVSQTKRVTLGKATPPDRCTEPAIVSHLSPEGEFRGFETFVDLSDPVSPRLPRAIMDALGASAGAEVGFTPMKAWHREEPEPSRAGDGVKAKGGKSPKTKGKSQGRPLKQVRA